MDPKDIAIIESLLNRQAEELLKRQSEETSKILDERFARQSEEASKILDERFARQAERTSTILDERLARQTEELNKGFDERERRIVALMEDMQGSINLIVDGQQGVVERIDRLEVELKDEIRKVDHRVTVLAADLATHKKDPAAHKVGYQVREEEEEFGEKE